MDVKNPLKNPGYVPPNWPVTVKTATIAVNKDRKQPIRSPNCYPSVVRWLHPFLHVLLLQCLAQALGTTGFLWADPQKKEANMIESFSPGCTGCAFQFSQGCFTGFAGTRLAQLSGVHKGTQCDLKELAAVTAQAASGCRQKRPWACVRPSQWLLPPSTPGISTQAI